MKSAALEERFRMKSAILEEWKELRAEITRKQSFAEHILVAAGAANFAILAYGLKDCAIEGVAVCLLPTVVTSVVYLWLLTYVFSGFRIASYIKKELEPKIPGFNWENWLSTNAGKFKFRIRNQYSLLAKTFYGISLAATLLKIILLYTSQNPPHYPVSALSIVVVVVWALWILGIHFFLINKAIQDIKNIHREIHAD
jgi:hypothetical protein